MKQGALDTYSWLSAAVVSSLSLVAVALAPFLGWALLISMSHSLGERSREIGSLYVLVLLPRVALLGLGAFIALAAGFLRDGAGAARNQVLLGMCLGLLSAAAILGWTRVIAPGLKPQILPGFLEGASWLALGFLGALAGIVAYSRVLRVHRIGELGYRGVVR